MSGFRYDSDGDECAAALAEHAAAIEGPPVTLPGATATRIAADLREAWELLGRAEPSVKEFRLRGRMRDLRVRIGTTLASLPTPPSHPGGPG